MTNTDQVNKDKNSSGGSSESKATPNLSADPADAEQTERTSTERTTERKITRSPASSTLCVCGYCGSTATFYGTPEEINSAAREFYQIHEHTTDLSGKRK